MKTNLHLGQYIAEFLLNEKRFRQNLQRNQNTYFVFNTLFFSKFVPFLK